MALMSALVRAAEFAQRWSEDRVIAQLLPVTPEHLCELSRLAETLFGSSIEEAREHHADKNLMMADVSFYPGQHAMFMVANWRVDSGQLDAGLFICAPADIEYAKKYVSWLWRQFFEI
jgi:hypothetical protein